MNKHDLYFPNFIYNTFILILRLFNLFTLIREKYLNNAENNEIRTPVYFYPVNVSVEVM